MKIHKQLTIDGKEYETITDEVILELNHSARALFSVKDTDNTLRAGQAVTFASGDFDRFHQVFLGYIENATQASNGYSKILCRELSGRLEKPIRYNARHCTLLDVRDFLNSQPWGIEFVINESADYANKPIPQLTHSGSGYQFINRLGDYFNISEYIWIQYPDGTLFLGAWADLPDYEDEREPNHRDSLDHNGNAAAVFYDSTLRPGQLFNGEKITKVTHNDSKTWIEWRVDGEKSPTRRAIEREFPEFAGGYHLSKMAEVIAIADPAKGGEIADPYRPHYAVDVRLLDEHNQTDQSAPVFEAVPLPVAGMASQGGTFAFPEIGTFVELGFLNGRSDQPIIRNFYPTNKTLPSVTRGEILTQQRPSVYHRIDPVGNMENVTDQNITEKSASRLINAESEIREVGTQIEMIANNAEQTIGGNASVQVLGNKEALTSGNESHGIDGNYQLDVNGKVKINSKSKVEMTAPLVEIKSPQTTINSPTVSITGSAISMGDGSTNVLSILEQLIQIVADLAQATATHTHQGVGSTQQAAQFSALNAKASAEKRKLSPMIG